MDPMVLIRARRRNESIGRIPQVRHERGYDPSSRQLLLSFAPFRMSLLPEKTQTTKQQ